MKQTVKRTGFSVFTMLIIFSVCALMAFSLKLVPPDPNKKYKVTLEYTISQWQAISNSLNISDQISAKFANEVNQAIFVQVSPQIADTVKPGSKTPEKK
jgi:hypothetical protein